MTGIHWYDVLVGLLIWAGMGVGVYNAGAAGDVEGAAALSWYLRRIGRRPA